MNFIINNTKCLSVNKKGSKTQCSNKRKQNSLLCGIHIKLKNIIYVSDLPEYNEPNEKNEENEENCYSKEYLINIFKSENINAINTLKVGKLRNTLKTYNLLNIIDKNQSKQNILKLLIHFLHWEKQYINNDDIKKIILMQSIIRKYNVVKRVKTVNDDECIQMISKFEIPLNLYYCLYDINSNKYYSFDITSLNIILKNCKPLEEPKNPYTLNIINQTEINKIKTHIKYLEKKGIILEYDNIITDEQKIEFKAIDIFQQINLLGNYTDPEWFTKLDIHLLKKLYNNTEDMINYRINLSKSERHTYFKNGISFPLKSYDINLIKSKRELREIILNEYEKILKYENDINDKKTSIMWLLIALTEVSYDANIALTFLQTDVF